MRSWTGLQLSLIRIQVPCKIFLGAEVESQKHQPSGAIMGLTILRLKPMTLPASPGAGRYLVFAWYKSRTIVWQASSRLTTHCASKSLIYKCDMLNYQEGELTEMLRETQREYNEYRDQAYRMSSSYQALQLVWPMLYVKRLKRLCLGTFWILDDEGRRMLKFQLSFFHFFLQ